MDLFDDALEKNCKGQSSIHQNSWFSGIMLSLEKKISPNLRLGAQWQYNTSRHETALDEETTWTETVIDWYITIAGRFVQTE